MNDIRTKRMLGGVLAGLLFFAAALAHGQNGPGSLSSGGSSGNSSSDIAPVLLPSAPSLPAATLYGSVSTAQEPTSSIIKLSLDDAVRRGLQHNLQVVLAAQNQRGASGERLVAFNYLLPTISWNAQRNRNQINLAAEGFRPSTFQKFPAGLFPPSAIPNIPVVVIANVVSAEATLKQTLFDLHSLELYRAAKQEVRAVNFSFQGTRGAVIQTVIDSYLQALASEANIANAKGLLAANAEILRDATLEDEAGTANRLDVLRARVQYQQQEQVVIAQQNAFAKAKVALNREIGLPADQPIQLTDSTPYAELTVMPMDQALRLAYTNRQEYLRLQAELRSAQMQTRAVRYERLPTVDFDGNYGVTGTVGGIYHGTFAAQGTLHIPIFREAKFRGDRDVANAAASNAMAQLANFRTQIQAQIRDNMVDVDTTGQLVNVARSNVGLAYAVLHDATVRFRNGIDTDLPVVQAQSSLAEAQTELVNSLYQYNVAKIALARSVGIIDRDYRAYLGTAKQTAMSGGLDGTRARPLTPAEYDQRNGQ